MIKQGLTYEQHEIGAAYESLARADELEPLPASDLELYATSAYMLGREDEWLKLMERACHLRAEAGEQRLAARCAFWIGMHLFLRGQMGPGTGWLGRAGRLLEGEGEVGAAVEQQARDGDRQLAAVRQQNGKVVEPGGAWRRRMATFALPGVEADVVVIAAGRNERRA